MVVIPSRRNISIHFPTRWTTCNRVPCNRGIGFQSTSPRGGRRYGKAETEGISTYFNPRPHEGDDITFGQNIGKGMISIHVPTRGTTEYSEDSVERIMISIHVPTRGTTGIWDKSKSSRLISIHVPRRGTTRMWNII